MQENKKYLFLSIIVLLMLFFFAYFFNEERKTKLQSVNWEEDYEEINKGPFGTFLTLKLLEEYFPNQDVTILKDSLTTKLNQAENPANYVFVGGKISMDSLAENSLLKFVEKGNKAFLSSKSPPIRLMQQIFEDYCEDFLWDEYETSLDSNAYFNLQHPNLTLDSILNIVYEEEFDTTIYQWHHFQSGFFCYANEHLVQLGSLNNNLVNFIKVDYGDGSFYFHTNPILYTNSVLIEKQGFEYAHRSFAHLQAGEIYWDAGSRISYFEENEYSGSGGNHSGNGSSSRGSGSGNRNGGSSDSSFEPGKKTFESEGPLQYILGQRSLAWAWYLTLILGLLYLLFRAKRRQRIIPVLEPNRNTSLEFISTIGRMYFVENNHEKLAMDKLKLFLTHVREQYQIPTQNFDTHFIQQVSNKAEVPKELIKKILNIQSVFRVSGDFTEEMLVKFHQTLDQFYKNCK